MTCRHGAASLAHRAGVDDTGGDEIIAEMLHLPPRTIVAEGWAPNVGRARDLLLPRGVRNPKRR
jgi:hypothetical protein